MDGTTTDIDTNKLFALYDRTNDRTYKYIPYEKFVKLVADPSNSSGASIWWTFWAKMIKLYPIPASIITFYLDYISLVTALTDAAVSCEIPAKYDPVIIDGVLVYAYMFDRELGDPIAQRKIFESGINGDGGVKGMISDNNMMINDGGETESHRVRRGGADNGKHGAFPLDSSF